MSTEQSIKIKKIVVKNYRGIGPDGLEIDIDDIVILVGPNNSGKSTILRAFELVSMDGLKMPYGRISYEKAISHLQGEGLDIEYGKGLGSIEEEMLSHMYDRPFWIIGIPKTIEPFPYCVDPSDCRVTMVADLIASNGYGELLGVAKKYTK